MKVLKIGGKDEGYEIVLDPKGHFSMSGRFLPRNAKEFFDPVTDWFTEYITNAKDKNILELKLDYFNTATSKKFLDIMLDLEKLKQENKQVTIEWYHQKDDVDILDAGKGYSELVDIEFIYIIY